jgi:hypothetical protein
VAGVEAAASGTGGGVTDPITAAREEGYHLGRVEAARAIVAFADRFKPSDMANFRLRQHLQLAARIACPPSAEDIAEAEVARRVRHLPTPGPGSAA